MEEESNEQERQNKIKQIELDKNQYNKSISDYNVKLKQLNMLREKFEKFRSDIVTIIEKTQNAKMECNDAKKQLLYSYTSTVSTQNSKKLDDASDRLGLMTNNLKSPILENIDKRLQELNYEISECENEVLTVKRKILDLDIELQNI